MEELPLMLLRGLVIGLVISAPMGPVGIYCIQRTLDKGRLSGFYTGVGAAISDFIYCLLTGFGISFIENFITTHRAPIQLFGSVVLILFGIWLLRKRPNDKIAADADQGAPSKEGDILKGFALTFSNPLILFLIIGLFAQFNFVIEGMKFYHYILGFIGIISGALGWWWCVTYFVDKLRVHFNQRTMKLINTVIGIIILIFAAVGIFSSASDLMAAPRMPAPQDVEIRAVEFRVADASMKGWRAEFSCGEESSVIMEVSPTGIADPFGDSRTDALAVKITEHPSGRQLAETTVKEGVDPYKGRNSWRVVRSGHKWNIFAGNREYLHVADFDSSLVPSGPPEIIPAASGSIDASCTGLVSAPIKESILSEADIMYAVGRGEGGPADLSGIYSTFDYEHDDTYARIGGSYRLAIARREADGGYDIYYLGGARINPTYWQAGMKKGRLKPTSFVNVYDVEWCDAEGDWMLHDVQAEYDALLHTLTVKFPYQGSSIRLRKE